MSRIMVTGGAGFLGSHLCDRLIAEGADVFCVDNLYTGSMVNLASIAGSERFRFLHHDVCLPLAETSVDRIYNLACPASPIHYQRDPVATLRTSVLGALNTLELARREGARVLQASTSEVYGDPQVHPQIESYWGNVNPIGIRSCYDEGKRCAETLFFDYHRQYGVDIKVMRIFNTYGPRMDSADRRVVSNLIVQALRGEPITIFGDGSQTRSFCYVDDMIEGMVMLMQSPAGFTGPINIGNESEFTIGELAEKSSPLPAAHPGSSSGHSRRTIPVSASPTSASPGAPSTGRQKLGWMTACARRCAISRACWRMISAGAPG